MRRMKKLYIGLVSLRDKRTRLFYTNYRTFANITKIIRIRKNYSKIIANIANL